MVVSAENIFNLSLKTQTFQQLFSTQSCPLKVEMLLATH
jgi:hypothetical protein